MMLSTQSKRITLSQLFILLILVSPITSPQDAAKTEAPVEGAEQPKASREEQKLIKEPRKKPELEKERIALLSKEIEAEDMHWIDSSHGKFMGLWREDKSDTPYGAILILHGNGQSVESPNSTKALRKNLSLHGWSTLAIGLPPSEKLRIPPRPNQEVQASAEEATMSAEGKKKMETPTENIKNAENISADRLKASVAFLKEKGQYNIVIIGHGIGAVRAAKYVDSISSSGMSGNSKAKGGKIQRPIRAMVFVEARNHIAVNGDGLEKYLNDPSLPVLDIYFGDHFQDNTETRARRIIAQEKKITHYYQVKILRPSDSNLDNENRLTRRVRGFLNKHAKGVEIERRN